jgi:hypothetical protein
MGRSPSKRPFAAITPRNAQSQNPKTIQNLAYRSAKRGIELAEFRDDAAFRTSKSRALKKLRTSDGWVNMSAEEQTRAEVEAIRILEQQRDAKKREHEKQWFQKVENQDIAPDEDDLAVNIKAEEHLDGNTVGTAAGDTVDTAASDADALGEDGEWSTDGSDEFGLDEDDNLDWISDFNDIKERYGDAFMKALTEAEKHAVKKDEEFLRH